MKKGFYKLLLILIMAAAFLCGCEDEGDTPDAKIFSGTYASVNNNGIINVVIDSGEEQYLGSITPNGTDPEINLNCVYDSQTEGIVLSGDNYIFAGAIDNTNRELVGTFQIDTGSGIEEGVFSAFEQDDNDVIENFLGTYSGDHAGSWHLTIRNQSEMLGSWYFSSGAEGGVLNGTQNSTAISGTYSLGYSVNNSGTWDGSRAENNLSGSWQSLDSSISGNFIGSFVE